MLFSGAVETRVKTQGQIGIKRAHTNFGKGDNYLKPGPWLMIITFFSVTIFSHYDTKKEITTHTHTWRAVVQKTLSAFNICTQTTQSLMNAGIRQRELIFVCTKKIHIKHTQKYRTNNCAKKLFFADYIQILILIKNTSLNVFDEPSKKKKYFIPYLPKPYIIIILNILQF